MKRIRQIISILLVFMMCLISGCSINKDKLKRDPDKISVVCTTFPQYDWMKQLIKGKEDKIDLTLLVDNGVDIHSYQATMDDIILMSESDLIVYVGGESDAWVEDAIEQAKNPDLKTINMMEVLGDNIKEEEVVEGMQGEGEEEHQESEELEYDEHVWLSLKNAMVIVDKMVRELGELDPDGKAVYDANGAEYVSALAELDVQYENAVSEAGKNYILFADRFPFRYLADDYGISYYAAFVGCSAETEASFETVTFLADKINELSLKYVLIIENSNTQLAQSVIDTSKKEDVQILTMDSIQSVNREDINAGVSYLGIMKDNLEVLKIVLQ